MCIHELWEWHVQWYDLICSRPSDANPYLPVTLPRSRKDTDLDTGDMPTYPTLPNYLPHLHAYIYLRPFPAVEHPGVARVPQRDAGHRPRDRRDA